MYPSVIFLLASVCVGSWLDDDILTCSGSYVKPCTCYQVLDDLQLTRDPRYNDNDKPAPTDFGLRRTAVRSPGLPFNGVHPRNLC